MLSEHVADVGPSRWIREHRRFEELQPAARTFIETAIAAVPDPMTTRSNRFAIALSVPYPAQQESCETSLVKVWAASFNPSTIVKYGKS